MVRLKIGDVFGIETSKGLAYFHSVHKDETIGSLIRILPSLHEGTQNEFLNDLVKQKELFFIQFTLGPALSRGIEAGQDAPLVGAALCPWGRERRYGGKAQRIYIFGSREEK
ncbi:hypothetical protein [Ureibacillus acetophenoni]|uniref:Uncharacterized protein n=1 Tax=Ureibacillus acetophenoni TaxID=614649 RepID=A0A285UPP8_9BACL|nr:hypothetical protein [Ureibacillus acetophenoni]SOC43677.1 hypothetical protein SAMN05877842_11710 [Ureibacillus acetophenoni]